MYKNLRIVLERPKVVGEQALPFPLPIGVEPGKLYRVDNCKIIDLDDPTTPGRLVQSLKFEIEAETMVPRCTISWIPQSIEIEGPMNVFQKIPTTAAEVGAMLRGHTFTRAEVAQLTEVLKECASGQP